MAKLLKSRFFLFLAGVTFGVLIPFIFLKKNDPRENLLQCPIPEELGGSIIQVAKAQEMYDEYTDRRLEPITEYEEEEYNKDRRDSLINITRHVNFEFSKIKSYFDYLSCINQKLISDGQNGIETIRIYFAHYPVSGEFNDGTLVKTDPSGIYSYKGQNTIMMLPTSIINESESGFMIKEGFGNIEIDTIRNNHIGYNSLILNEAGLTPPPPQQTNDFGG